MNTPRAAVDFTEIESEHGLRFEQFIEALLRALGWTIIAGAGIGPDGGRDIIAAQTESTATGRSRPRKYVVQCKHYAGSRRSVSPGDIGGVALLPATHQCDGWLLVTSTQLTTNAVNTIGAARQTVPALDFDYWDSGRLCDLLMRDECHRVFAEYLPASYGRFAHILTPSIMEIRSLVSTWLATSADRSDLFSLDYDTESSLLGFVVTRRQTLQDLRTLLVDELLSDEFMAVWKSNLARGAEKAPGVTLLNGLRRLRQLREKGLPEDARHNLLIHEISNMAEHRDLKRRCWREFVIHRGTAPAWTTVRATSENAYLPPVDLYGAVFAFFCAERDQGASGRVRFGNAEPDMPFIASYSIESILRVERHFMQLLEFELMTEPGSDAVVIAGIGFSEFQGQWNILA